MRGSRVRNFPLFTSVPMEEKIGKTHPLHEIKSSAEETLEALDERLDALYANSGRLSIPPEQLLLSLLLQSLQDLRSERVLLEQLDYNSMFR